MISIQELSIPGFEKVLEITDPLIGLHAFVAIHNTTLGPALGGLRIFPYMSREEALTDVLRLAQGMSYKSAASGLKFGGGKSVIMADSRSADKTPLLLAMADVLNLLQGQYIAAEDMGTTPYDMEIIHTKTPHVAARCHATSSGDPSRFTAWGVFRGVEAVAEKVWGTPQLQDKVIALQGVGNVGAKLAEHLFWRGARLIIADTNTEKAHEVASLYRAEVVDTHEILSVPCDIFSPCAQGGILNDETIPLLNCKAVAGGANNQLLHSKNAWDLMHRGILYAPDFLINAGGVINATAEFDPGGYDPRITRAKVNHIGVLLHSIFVIAELQHKPPNLIVEELAEARLKAAAHPNLH